MDRIRKSHEATVYHSTVSPADYAKYGRPPHFPRYYDEVARIAVTGLPSAPTLEEYEKECNKLWIQTMHIQGDWRENPGVRVTTSRELVRSTEMGDVIAFDTGRTFRSEFKGWLEFIPDRRPEPRMSQLDQIGAVPRWETLRGIVFDLDKKKLFPEEVARTIPRIGEQDVGTQKDWIVHARLTPPDHSWSTYVMELDLEDGKAFALRRDHKSERSSTGIFDINKFEGPVGRDPSWRPEVLSMIPLDWQSRERGLGRELTLGR
jgi:hypothetical protein